MERSEFRRRINRAERNLKWRDGPDIYYDGVCDSLARAFRTIKVEKLWNRLFKPKYTSKAYWLGYTNSRNYPLRLMALRMFEREVLDRRLFRSL